MRLLTIAPDDNVVQWLASLCETQPSYQLTRCINLTEALRALAVTDYDWILSETASEIEIATLRQTGCRGTFIQLRFDCHPGATASPAPSLVCIVENGSHGQRILDCRLAARGLRVADPPDAVIYEYRGSTADPAVNG